MNRNSCRTFVPQTKTNNMNNNILNLMAELVKKNGCTFVRVKNYTNAQGEVQDVTINVGTSYENAKKRDLQFLQGLNVSTLKHNYSDVNPELLETARLELIKSIIAPNKAMSEGQKNAYVHLMDGLKFSPETKQIYIFGTKVEGTKVVTKAAEYKADTRKPLTKAKDIIRKDMSTGKYRQYVLSQLGAVTINKQTLELS